MNTENEFPSLVSESKSNAIFSGSVFSKQTSNAWGSKKKEEKKEKKTPRPIEIPKPSVVETQPTPAIYKIEPQNDFIEPNKKNKKKKNKANKTGETLEKKEDEFIVELDEPIETLKVKEEAALPPPPLPPPGFGYAPSEPSPKSSTPPPGFEFFSQTPNIKLIKSQMTNTHLSEFIKPEKYEARNQTLTAKLADLFGIYNETEFLKFKDLSIEFRKGNLKAKDYLNQCQLLLDLPLYSNAYTNKNNLETRHLHVRFLDLVQEMIVLLPDSARQIEIYEAYLSVVETLNLNQNLEASKKITGWGTKAPTTIEKINFINRLDKCEFCEQIFINSEIGFHQTKYHPRQLAEAAALEKAKAPVIDESEDFPALGLSVSKTPAVSAPVSLAKKLQQPSVPRSKSPQLEKEPNLTEEFPPLGGATPPPLGEFRFSTMPTPSLFTNPSSHLSLVNKKKHRLQK